MDLSQRTASWIIYVLYCMILIPANESFEILSNDTVPEVGETLKLSYVTPSVFNTGTISWIGPTGNLLGRCYAILGLCSGNSTKYSFLSDQYGAHALISSLNRSTDSGNWSCIYMNGTANEARGITVIVYSSPKGVDYVQPIPPNTNLGMESVTLKCRTRSCAYPAPALSWYYNTTAGEMILYPLPDFTMTVDDRVCPQSEVGLTSILYLPRGRTFIANVDLTTKFQCRGNHTTVQGETLYSQLSNSVSFAVNLSFVTLKDQSGNELIEKVHVIQGSDVTFMCVTSGSRPKASIQWLIGQSQIASGFNETEYYGSNGLVNIESILVITPNSQEHHGKYLYCRAFTISQNEVVTSSKPTLFVKVMLTNVELRANGQVINSAMYKVATGHEITLSCIAGFSRPAPQFLWYLGTQLEGAGSTLSFTPTTQDHGKEIYCKAYNFDIESAVYSQRPMLQVIGIPARPTHFAISSVLERTVIFTWLPGDSDGFAQMFVIQGRPDGEETWQNMSVVSDMICRSMGIVDNLERGKMYMFRIYSYTIVGPGHYADNIVNVTLAEGLTKESTSCSSNIGPIIGGTLSGLILGVCLTMLFFKLRLKDNFWITCIPRRDMKYQTRDVIGNTKNASDASTYQNIEMGKTASEQVMPSSTVPESNNEEQYEQLSRRDGEYTYDKIE